MKPVTSLTADELKRLLAVTKQKSEMYWLLFLLCFQHGLRVSEALGLRREHFSATDVYVARLKHSLPTLQELSPEARAALAVYLPKVTGLRIFPVDRRTVDRKIKAYGAEAGIHPEKLHSHVLKRTCGMLMLKGGANLEYIRARLGHTTVAVTSKAYCRADDTMANAAFAQAMTNLREGKCSWNG